MLLLKLSNMNYITSKAGWQVGKTVQSTGLMTAVWKAVLKAIPMAA